MSKRTKPACILLIVDGSALLRRGLRAVIETEQDAATCVEAADGAEAVAKATELRPHVAFVSTSLPDTNGLHAMTEIRKASPSTKVILLARNVSADVVESAMRAGASGFVLESAPVEQILSAKRSVMAAGERYVSADVEALLRTPAGRHSLSSREKQIVGLIVRGFATKEIAAQLALSPKTVDTHRANIMRKLGLRSATALVSYAIRFGLADL